MFDNKFYKLLKTVATDDDTNYDTDHASTEDSSVDGIRVGSSLLLDQIMVVCTNRG